MEESDFKPKIYTAIADSGVTLSLLYIAHYREMSATRNRINRRLVAELEPHPHVQLAFHTVSVLHETPAAGARRRARRGCDDGTVCGGETGGLKGGGVARRRPVSAFSLIVIARCAKRAAAIRLDCFVATRFATTA